jgi:hypothetical protein
MGSKNHPRLIMQRDNFYAPGRPRAVPAKLLNCLSRLCRRRGNGQAPAIGRARSGWLPQCRTCARGREAHESFIQPAMEIIHERSRSCLANPTTQASRLAANLSFDVVELSDPLNSFASNG